MPRDIDRVMRAVYIGQTSCSSLMWNQILMQTREPEEWESPKENQKNGGGSCAYGCLSVILFSIIFIFVPLPETPIKAYPVYGKSSFDVLRHRVMVSLGAFEQYEQSRHGMKRHFKVWVDVPNERREDSVSLKCSKLQYRIDGGQWRDADRAPEGDYRGGGSARIWYWSPLISDLELLDANRKSQKMRPGSYDLKLEFEDADGAKQTLETNLTLRDKTERHWRSILDYLDELSGIN